MATRDFQLPQGVLDAEARILEEQRESEQRAVREGMQRLASDLRASCEHDDMLIDAHYDSSFDDHWTSTGYCESCDRWLVITGYKGHREPDVRDMTNDERRLSEARLWGR